MACNAIPGAAPVLLAGQSPSNADAGSSLGASVLPTPDSRGAAYVLVPDSVRLYDPVARASRPLTRGCIGLIAFSPDGQQLLCRGNGGLFIATVADGSLSAYALPAGRSNSSLNRVRWGAGGVQLIFTGAFSTTELVDVTSGATRVLMTSGQLV